MLSPDIDSDAKRDHQQENLWYHVGQTGKSLGRITVGRAIEDFQSRQVDNRTQLHPRGPIGCEVIPEI